ncbi:hypothetical protein ccbrp13_16810 [Ktedonobacteria bacterium brp13]|nr:hypothetical protein ccbrp13_16810 [Ktedonobacteria bacterium brp13]
MDKLDIGKRKSSDASGSGIMYGNKFDVLQMGQSNRPPNDLGQQETHEYTTKNLIDILTSYD